MSEEFKLEINLTEKPKFYQIHACVRCVDGECSDIIEKLKEEYEGDKHIEDYLCLIMMKIKIKKGDDRELFMSDFYNNVTKMGRGLSHLNRKLKGGARAILCIVLKKALSVGLIKMDDKIYLEASGDLEDDIGNSKDMMGLVKYYQHLGFKITNDDNLDEQLSNLSVYMFGVVESLLNKCNEDYKGFGPNSRISPELRRIIEQIN
jgi:hypothetical protein